MNAKELKEALQVFYDNYDEIGVTVYVLLKDQENVEPQKLDIESISLNSLKDVFIQSLQNNITSKEDLAVLNLSTSDERTDAIYVYDLEIPHELSSLETVVQKDNLPLFNLQNDDISNIKELLIEI